MAVAGPEFSLEKPAGTVSPQSTPFLRAAVRNRSPVERLLSHLLITNHKRTFKRRSVASQCLPLRKERDRCRQNPLRARQSRPCPPRQRRPGLGVVRVSGRDAVAVASRVFRPASPSRSLDSLSGYTAAYGHVTDEEGDIDECVALVFRAPHSYTGEDVVEFSCHGGPYLLSRVLRALFAAGARPAGPGEFTRRAFLNGKLDLTGAEAVMGLIAADGQLAARHRPGREGRGGVP